MSLITFTLFHSLKIFLRIIRIKLCYLITITFSRVSFNRGSVTIRKGGMGREVGGRFGREGTWVYLWLILVDVWPKKKNSINSYPSIKKKKLEKKEIQKLSCHLKFYTLNFRASFFPTRLMALMQIMNMKKSHLKG